MVNTKEKPEVTINETPRPLDEEEIQELGDQVLLHNDNEKSFKDLSEEERNRITERFGVTAEEHNIAPRTDIEFVIGKIEEITEDQAVEILLEAIDYHSDDPNFPSETMSKIQLLVKGPKVGEWDDIDEYNFQLKSEAAIIRYHSPYPEVRAVADPTDDPTIPVETPRAYFLGMALMAGSTIVNTFFSPRQPAISISSQVLQLLLAPCGAFLAKILPNWGFGFLGRRFDLNPGPWSFKEQMFATIIFNVGNGPGVTYYAYLVQLLPQYLGQTWVVFGYEILLAISIQMFGFAFAGLMRRVGIYPYKAIWPKVLPTLALNRALIMPEKKEVIHGWKISRYRFFLIAFAGMFVYFFIPNFLFTGLRLFNWMTWIAPNHFTLNMITGGYGGMGFNPISSLDYNVAGTGSLTTPFFSTALQYVARVLSGLIIIGMYWGNYVWSAYMPINSNEIFTNTGIKYDENKIVDSNNKFDIDKYKDYGPSYFSGANVFGQGAWFAWYSMTLFYVFITQWKIIKESFVNTYRGFRYREHFADNQSDPHSQMMRNYKEVPEWWFFCILIFSLALGIIALEVYPTDTPVWSLFVVIGINALLLIPTVLLLASANVSLGFGVLFQMLSGIFFPGNPVANIIFTSYGGNFDSQTDNYLSDLKMGHYAKIPPRAMFRGQTISVIINCFIFIGFLNWMVSNFQSDSLCTWDSPSHFVCTNAVLVYASAIEYGTFGIKNMFELYPILPWCFLMGAVAGVGFAIAHRWGYKVVEYTRKKCSEQTQENLEKRVYRFLRPWKIFNPCVFWAGSLNWTGGNNLSYATNALYFSFIFMYIIKRRYTAWFQKYNYLLESGFGVGIAISGIVQTFAFQFQDEPISLDWWGNHVSEGGLDWQSYNQNSSLLPVPDKGYFGPSPENYPMHF